jgi:hypothetical protein
VWIAYIKFFVWLKRENADSLEPASRDNVALSRPLSTTTAGRNAACEFKRHDKSWR